MEIDFHTHAKWAKSADFSYAYYREMMRSAALRGLKAVALTEHFDTRRFGEIYGILDREALYSGSYYEVEGVKAFPGIEVDVAEGGHILLIGDRDGILEIRDRLDGHEEKGKHVGLERLLDLSEPYGCLRIGAHPYREQNPLCEADPEQLARLDALDLNGRDLYRYGRAMESRVKALADGLGIAVVAGSDSHQPLQFGCVANRLARRCDTATQLRETVRQGGCRYRLSPRLDAMVRSAEAEQARYKREGWPPGIAGA